jgi:drug/metabolite transporter (DMT)-like permease
MRLWFAFFFLAVLAWGPSFMWIKVALQEIGPLELTMYRMAFGAATAWTLLKVLHLPVRFTRQRLLGSMFVGLTGLAIPMSLLSWGETRIDSGLAGILNGTVPLWTFIIAHFFLHDERITRIKAAGLSVGFIGLAVLVSRDLDWEGIRSGSIWGQAAVIGMAISYSISMVFTRRYLKGQHPVHTASISILTSFVILLILTLTLEPSSHIPRLPMTWLACGWMGIVGLGLALWAYYHLLNHWGATRSSLVTYLVPVMAVTLGIIFLNERITWHLLVGGTLIIGGIALVNRKKQA